MPLGDPVAQQVLDAFLARLETIAPPDYRSTVDSVVLLEPGRDVTAHGDTVLAIVPGVEVENDYLVNCVETRQRVLVVATMRVLGEADTWRRPVRALLADVASAIRLDAQFGGLVRDAHILEPTILPRSGTALARGELEVELVFGHLFTDDTVPA